MTTLTEKELLALISSSRNEDEAKLTEFLDTAPTMVANHLLYDIASKIPRKYVTSKEFWLTVPVVLCITFGVVWIIQDVQSGKPLWPALRTSPCMHGIAFMLLFTCSREVAKVYREAEDALFLLSARNDSRALPLLIEHWQRHPAGKTKDWNDRVEAEATRLLDGNKSGTTPVEWKTLRKVVTQIVKTSRDVRDITLGQSYFAAAILRTLARTSEAENGKLLKAFSEMPADAERFPNRTFVAEVAQVCYGAPDTPPVMMPTSVANSTAYQQQTLRRP